MGHKHPISERKRNISSFRASHHRVDSYREFIAGNKKNCTYLFELILMCPSLNVSTGKDARNFGEIIRQLWGGKKQKNLKQMYFIMNTLFTHIWVFSISTE